MLNEHLGKHFTPADSSMMHMHSLFDACLPYDESDKSTGWTGFCHPWKEGQWKNDPGNADSCGTSFPSAFFCGHSTPLTSPR